jgi:hypothetical protein
MTDAAREQFEATMARIYGPAWNIADNLPVEDFRRIYQDAHAEAQSTIERLRAELERSAGITTLAAADADGMRHNVADMIERYERLREAAEAVFKHVAGMLDSPEVVYMDDDTPCRTQDKLDALAAALEGR